MVRRSGHPERRVTLDLGVSHFGRADDNDVVLSDIGVSRRHARVVVRQDGVFVEDLGSGNGTYFQGVRISSHTVQHGDEILIDPFSLSFDVEEFFSASSDGLTNDLEDVGDEDTVEVTVNPTVDPTNAPNPKNDVQLRRARLTTIRGQRLAPSYPLRPTGLTIGRSDARDVILFDPAASRNHAQLEFVGQDVWLRDHGSGNGTFVNGSRVREQCLRHGDRVRVGSTEFRFELLDGDPVETATLPPAASAPRVMAPRPLVVPPEAGNPPPSESRPARLLAVAAFGAVAAIVVMVVGGLVALYVVDPALRGRAEVSGSMTNFVVPIEARAAVSKHLRRGDRHFDDGNYLKAASQYHAAQKLVPGHPEARRLGVLSTENLVLAVLREGLVLRNLPDQDKKSMKSQAFRLAKQALAGRGDRKDAVTALRNVMIFSPDDQRAKSLLYKLDP